MKGVSHKISKIIKHRDVKSRNNKDENKILFSLLTMLISICYTDMGLQALIQLVYMYKETAILIGRKLGFANIEPIDHTPSDLC